MVFLCVRSYCISVIFGETVRKLNLAICLFFHPVWMQSRAHKGCFQLLSYDWGCSGCILVNCSLVNCISLHFSATLWLQLQVLCVMGLWVAACLCFGDCNCNVLVPGLGYFLPGMVLLVVSVAHVLCWWFSSSMKLTLKFCHSGKKWPFGSRQYSYRKLSWFAIWSSKLDKLSFLTGKSLILPDFLVNFRLLSVSSKKYIGFHICKNSLIINSE